MSTARAVGTGRAMGIMDERELFRHRYPQDADRVFGAVKRALATMDVRGVDDASRTATFNTGVSLTSWGSHLLAEVVPEGTGAQLVVRGRPKGSFMTTRWGENLHAREVEKQLLGAVDEALGARV